MLLMLTSSQIEHKEAKFAEIQKKIIIILSVPNLNILSNEQSLKRNF